jgi:4-oxalocrotonate tautomerase
MPFITLQIAKGHSVEKKRELAQALTETLVNTLGTRPEWVSVYIDEFERENWAVAGELLSDKHEGRLNEKKETSEVV